MPKLAPSRSEKQDIITRGVLGRIEGEHDMTNKDMAALLGCSDQTYRKRKKKPDTFTLLELRRLSNKGWLTDEEKTKLF